MGIGLQLCIVLSCYTLLILPGNNVGTIVVSAPPVILTNVFAIYLSWITSGTFLSLLLLFAKWPNLWQLKHFVIYFYDDRIPWYCTLYLQKESLQCLARRTWSSLDNGKDASVVSCRVVGILFDHSLKIIGLEVY